LPGTLPLGRAAGLADDRTQRPVASMLATAGGSRRRPRRRHCRCGRALDATSAAAAGVVRGGGAGSVIVSLHALRNMHDRRVQPQTGHPQPDDTRPRGFDATVTASDDVLTLWVERPSVADLQGPAWLLLFSGGVSQSGIAGLGALHMTGCSWHGMAASSEAERLRSAAHSSGIGLAAANATHVGVVAARGSEHITRE
jgi:hypothetical protein